MKGSFFISSGVMCSGFDCNWKLKDLLFKFYNSLSSFHFILYSFHSWKGSKPAKVVYVDPPLLRKEMTVRERNQIFHEIPMDFLATKTSYVPISDVSMDRPAEDSLLQWDVCRFTYS